jgi:hypothetical protein
MNEGNQDVSGGEQDGAAAPRRETDFDAADSDFANPVAADTPKNAEPDGEGAVSFESRAGERREAAARAALESALAGLRDGSVTEAAAVRTMERLMEAKLAADRGSMMGLDRAIRSVFSHLSGECEDAAHLTVSLVASTPCARAACRGGLTRAGAVRSAEAPTNWHQGMIFYLTSEDPQDAGMRARAPLLFASSWAMVLLQCCTALAVTQSTVLPSCKTSDQCPAGLYCQIGFNDRCQFCGSNVPLVMQHDDDGGTYNAVFHERFVGYNATYGARRGQVPPPITPA